MYQAFIVTKMLIDIRNLNRNSTSDSLSQGVGRYIENYRLYTSVFSLSGAVSPDAVRFDFVSEYADEITPKSTNPDQDGFNYFSLGNSNNIRTEILSDLGDDFLYNPTYSSGEGISNRKWYDLVGNNKQFLAMLNLKRWRIGLMGLTSPRFSGKKHTIILDSNGDTTEQTADLVNVFLAGNLESYFDVSFSSQGVQTFTEVYFDECVLIVPSNPQFETDWVDVQKIISKERNTNSEAGTDIETFDSKITLYNDASAPFELRSSKPTGVSNGENKRNQYDYQRGLTILPEYTLDEIYSLLQVPY